MRPLEYFRCHSYCISTGFLRLRCSDVGVGARRTSSLMLWMPRQAETRKRAVHNLALDTTLIMSLCFIYSTKQAAFPFTEHLCARGCAKNTACVSSPHCHNSPIWRGRALSPLPRWTGKVMLIQGKWVSPHHTGHGLHSDYIIPSLHTFLFITLHFGAAI